MNLVKVEVHNSKDHTSVPYWILRVQPDLAPSQILNGNIQSWQARQVFILVEEINLNGGKRHSQDAATTRLADSLTWKEVIMLEISSPFMLEFNIMMKMKRNGYGTKMQHGSQQASSYRTLQIKSTKYTWIQLSMQE